MCGMLRRGNRFAALVGLILLAWSFDGTGQEAESPALARADAEAAFGWVQGWVRSKAGVPDDADLPDRPVTGVFGVYITLREEGRILGRGQVLREDAEETIDQPGPAVQLPALVAAATRQALDDLRTRQMNRAVELGIADNELFKQALMAKRQRLQVDIQLGYNLESIVLPLDGEDAAVFGTFAPGYHGLRMAGPLATPEYAWPATEVSRNTSPLRLMLRLLDKQGYDADALPVVARADGPALQRFKIFHMVRPGPAQPMRELIRGNLILQQQVIDERTINGLAERVARYLDGLILDDPITGRPKMRGAYQPSKQDYAPQWSEPRQSALACFALARHARIKFDDDDAGEAMRSRVKRVLRLVEQLESKALPEPGKPKHLTAAFLLMALCESPINLDPQQIALRDRLGKALLDLHHPEGGGYRVIAGSEKRLKRASAAVITAALASWYEQTRNRKRIEPVWSVLGELMDVNAQTPRVIDLVWVSHAISKAGPIMAEAHPDTLRAFKELETWKGALAEYLDLLSEQQVRAKPLLGPEDVTGGFILKTAAPGSPPNPTWESAMPLTVIALGMRDPKIVPTDKIFGPILTAGLGARFLGQLMITEPSAYYLRDLEPAIGGVRNTLWDNTLYPDCSSMTLLALAELSKTLTALEPEEE